jgi:hypothetical protein
MIIIIIIRIMILIMRGIVVSSRCFRGVTLYQDNNNCNSCQIKSI